MHDRTTAPWHSHHRAIITCPCHNGAIIMIHRIVMHLCTTARLPRGTATTALSSPAICRRVRAAHREALNHCPRPAPPSRQPLARLNRVLVAFCTSEYWTKRAAARAAGKRRFFLLSALRAHANAPHATDLLWKTRRALNRPRGAPGRPDPSGTPLISNSYPSLCYSATLQRG
jgi:hypothetical protein